MANLDSSLANQVKYAMLSMQRHSWEQGVAAYALIEAGDYRTAVMLAREAVVNQAQDGRLALLVGERGAVDPASNYGPVLFAAKSTGDPLLRSAAGKMKSYIMNYAPRTATGIVSHFNDCVQLWSDSIFMLPPLFAEARMPFEAFRQICGYREALFDENKHLYHHIWDDDNKRFEQAEFWGGGNGWAAVGMARVIKMLPESMANERQTLCSWLEEVIKGCLEYIRQDGLFYDIVDDDSSFVETNLSQMLAYAIYYSVDAGFLNSHYLFYADAMREGALKKIDSDGFVCDACGAPSFNSPGTSTEAQAFALLMETMAKKCGR